MNLPAQQILKTLVVHASNDEGKPVSLVALVLRGDHELNEIKAAKLEGVASPITFASEAEIRSVIGCAPGSIGPCDLPIPVIADRSAVVLADFVCGANQDGKHWRGVNWDRDCRYQSVADIRNVVAGDASPDGQGTLVIKRGIEVGHIFQLGTKYSQAMNATVLDEQGKSVVMPMGCYGIGVSRIVAAAIEQNHDAHGILWPDAIAPFQIALLSMNAHKAPRVLQCAEELYQKLQEAGYEVFYDDRKERPGVKFADSELLGIPHRIVVGEKGLDNGVVEYKGRRDSESQDVTIASLPEFFASKINSR